MQEASPIDQQQTRTMPSLSDQDLMNMLADTPLFKAVNDIEELVKEGLVPSEVAGAKGRPYIDIKVWDLLKNI